MSQNTGVIIVMLALAGWPPLVHAQTQPQPVKAALPSNELSFEKRWQPELTPPAIDLVTRENPVKTFRVTRQVEGMIPGATPILPTHTFIRDETTARLKPYQEVSIRVDAPSPLPPEPPVVRKVVTETQKVSKRVAVLDICQRHGLKKVHYGKTWRCRK